MTDTENVPSAQSRSVTELVEDASAQITGLVRDEIRLAGLEMRTKGQRFGRGAGLAGAGALLAWYGGGALVAAVVLALALAVPGWAAASIVGAVLLVAGALLALAGKKDVQQASPPVPSEAIAGVEADIRTVKEGRNQ
ncbi:MULTISPECIES: phage holin family protein [Nocardia]|uniref:phage holin family protein n=1 Tax=Nocardia TaxID=1817 RepID=UPI000D687000|nr:MULTISPECIES: phage holin family protein [Nocardia]